MRVKLLASLLLVGALVCTGMLTTVSESGTKTKKPSEVGAAPAEPANRARQEQPADDDPYVTDGEKHPERIPDHVAYSLLFRMIANRKTDEEKGRIRAYLAEAGLGKSGCPTCPKMQPQDASRGTDADADALIAAAEEYHRRVGVLDRRAKELKQRGKAEAIPNVKGQLTALQRQKEVLVIGIVNSLSARLSANGLEKVRQHVNERVKRKVKIRTEPGRPDQPNPGGGSAT